MMALLTTWARATAAVWPTVLAWFLGGTVIREAVLSLAAPLGAEAPLAAFLLLPLAVLARLVSYVGMFLAVRRAMPSAALLAAVPHRTSGRGFTEFLDILLAAIIPFFVLYGLIGLLQQDLDSYANRAARWAFGSVDFLRPGDGPMVVAVIVIAFLGRLAFKHLGGRLPRWTGLVEVYLEATWIFVAVSGLVATFGSVLGWVQRRQVVQAVLDARQWMRDLWEPVKAVIDGIDGLVPVLVQLLALPLAWLLIAGIVYTRDLAAVAEERVVSRRIEAALRAGLRRVPARIARRRHLVTDEWDDVYKPLSVAGRLVLRWGWRPLALFAALWALLSVGQTAALWIVTRAVGAQSVSFWIDAYPIVYIAVASVAEVLRACLLGAAFDGALRAWRMRHPEVPPAGSGAVGEIEPEGLLTSARGQDDVDGRGSDHV